KNDFLAELTFRRDEATEVGSYWLDALSKGGVQLQVCPFATVNTDALPELGLRRGVENVAAFNRLIRENPDRAFAVRYTEDLDHVRPGSRIGLMLAMESTEALGYDHETISVFWELGLRMASLTWNRRTPFADGVTETSDGGLSGLGRRLVDLMNELGMIID